MTLSFQRCVVSGILVVWGVLLTCFYLTGKLSAYLHPSFHVWTLVSGLTLLLMAAGVLILPGGRQVLCEENATENQTRRSHAGLVIKACIMVLPLVITLVFSPGQYGATAVLNRGYVNNISDLPAYQPYKDPPLPTDNGVPANDPNSDATDPALIPHNAEGQIKAEPVDLLYAAQEPGMRPDFENKEVEMIGQYMPTQSNNASGNRFSLVKMLIVCCAADARPVAVKVEAPKGTKIPEMSWVRVTGKATFPVEGGREIPLVVADHVEICDPPADTFIYN